MKSRNSKQDRHGKGRGFRAMRRDGKLSYEDVRMPLRASLPANTKKRQNRHRFSREDIIGKFDDDGELSREER